MSFPLMAKGAGFRSPYTQTLQKACLSLSQDPFSQRHQGPVQSIPRAGIKWQRLEARRCFVGLVAATPMGLSPRQGQLKPRVGFQEDAVLAADIVTLLIRSEMHRLGLDRGPSCLLHRHPYCNSGFGDSQRASTSNHMIPLINAPPTQGS